MSRWAKFDVHGVCQGIVSRVPEGAEGVYEVPDNATPDNIWFDGSEVLPVSIFSGEIPDRLDVSDTPYVVALPPNTIAHVDGVLQVGELVIPLDTPHTSIVDISGAQAGRFRIAIRSYADERRDAYPAIEDQLDALWKGLPSLMAGGKPSADLQDMLSRVQAVKTRFPKSREL